MLKRRRRSLRRYAALPRSTADGSVAYVLEGGYGIDALTCSIAAIAAVHDGARAPAASADSRAIPLDVRKRIEKVSHLVKERS